MRKKERTLIILAVIAVLAIVSYFVLSGILKDNDGQEEQTEAQTQQGEIAEENRILMFEHIDSNSLRSLQVWNSKGSYLFKYDTSLKKFVIEGMEAAPYDSSAFYNIVVSAGYPIALSRLDEPSENLATYGLEAGGEEAKYTIISRDGNSYTVRIGDKVPMGTGYYAMLEGREQIYILSDSVSALLAPITSLIRPVAVYPVSSEQYQQVDDFMIKKNGEKFYQLDMVPPTKDGEEYDYVMKSPEGYSPNLYAYSAILEKLAELQGSEVVAVGKGKDGLSSNTLKLEYGIDVEKPYYSLSYTVNKSPSISIFSEPDENGDMYVYYMPYDIVSKINISQAEFIKWDRLKFIETRIIGFPLTTVSSITVTGNIDNGGEKLAVDSAFSLKSYFLSPDDKTEALFVTNSKTGVEYDSDRITQFRNLYRVIIRMFIYGDTDREDTENMQRLATVRIKLEDGEEHEFVFYSYSTRRCFFTVNGKGEFYCLRDDVEKMLRDTDRFENGKTIDFDSGN